MRGQGQGVSLANQGGGWGAGLCEMAASPHKDTNARTCVCVFARACVCVDKNFVTNATRRRWIKKLEEEMD